MPTPNTQLHTWFTERPKWLQEAARRLIERETLTEKDYAELVSLCIKEASGDRQVLFVGPTAEALGFKDAATELRIQSISDVVGINALSPTKPLILGQKNLTIVYGRNGAGKSSFVRLLKHACGSRNPGTLLRNVFNKDSKEQRATFTYTLNAKEESASWAGKPIAALAGVDIFDSACASFYVNKENEVAFEPWLLRLFTRLTRTCEEVNSRLKLKVQSLPSKKPLLPAEYSSTTGAAWYPKINSRTPVADIEVATQWTAKHEQELKEITKRLAEADPSTKANELRRRAKAVEQFQQKLQSLYSALTDIQVQGYLDAKADAKAKQLAADVDAQSVFSGSTLSGVGSESWRLLWNAAQRYSTEEAYKGKHFPNVGSDAHCVLCQQPLAAEAAQRLQTFENFVKGELQRVAKTARETLETKAKAFPNLPADHEINTTCDALGLTSEKSAAILQFAAALNTRKNALPTLSGTETLPSLPPQTIFDDLRSASAELIKQADAFDSDAKAQNRASLRTAQKELEARKWLNQQRPAIDLEVSRLAAVEELTRAQALCNTTTLSKKKSSLANELITDAYVERFEKELKTLKANIIPVELRKTRADAGHVYHRLFLKSPVIPTETGDVLSEGEFRIISLAAFLADTEGREAKTTFIFDDPISSLDQVFEDATAQRLVSLSKHRQVIVFTHRLSLLAALEKYSDLQSIEAEVISLSNIRKGEVSDLPIDLAKTKQAANRLLNERLKRASSMLQEGDQAYETEAKALCRDIRVLLEKVVENDLLNGVVRRHSNEVQTKGKLRKLSKITEEDCRFVDELMTQYSRYEHSQSEESPVALPPPTEIEQDLKSIAAFIDTLQKRNKE